MRLIIYLFISCVALTLEAKPPPLRYDKTTVIEWSHEHFDQAIVELKKADKIRWYVPDLASRNHFMRS